MNTYKIVTVNRWDGTSARSTVVQAVDLDQATINYINTEWENEEVFTSLPDAKEAIWGEMIFFDGGESVLLELDEGTEVLIVKIA